MLEKPSLNSAAFPDAGIYVLRSERIYLAAVCHKIGVNGIGPHKHNDWLSFELCVDDQPVIIDPGTYSYTGNMKMRRLFRSTAYHNTVVVDGEEQIPIHDSMFGLNNPSGDVTVLCWKSDKNRDVLEAEHMSYTRLWSPVIHQRRFFVDKIKNFIEIIDTFKGKGQHLLEWYFHLDTTLECKLRGQTAVMCRDELPILEIEFDGLEGLLCLKKGWVSRSYNKREEGTILYRRCRLPIEGSSSFAQTFEPLNNAKKE